MSSLDLGFDEFVSTLLRGVFEAVITSGLDQEKQIAALAAEASASIDDVAKGLESAVVEQFLIGAFPSDDPAPGHGIVVGASYTPADPGPEEPPVAAILGLALVAGVHYERVATGLALTLAGVEAIEERARLELATRQLAALRASLERGLPRVLVDAGKVSARLELSLVTETRAPLSPAFFARRPAGPPAVSRPAPPPEPRLLVRPVSPRAPEVSRASVDVFGEVEVRFKTVSR